MKKAFELQFHWMFVIIAGALILGFFVKIALQQENLSKNKIYLDYTKRLGNTFNTITQNPNIPTNFSISNDKIKFSCDNVCNCKYALGIIDENFNEKIIFAPNEITQIVQAFSFEWNVPFRATNFLYLTDNSKKYVLLYDDSDISQKLLDIIKNTLPKSINQEFMHVKDINSVKKQKLEYKFVFLNTNVIYPASFDNEEAQGLLITRTNVEFLKKEKRQSFIKISSYQIIPYEKGMIIAAIISNDDLFKCNMINAFEKLHYISKLYEQKSTNTELINFESSRCSGSYNTAKTLFNQFSINAKQTADSKLSNQINLPINDIKTLNDNIERDSCPRVL